MTRYKTVALNTITAKPKDTADKALAPVAKAIENEAVGGWKFNNMYMMPIEVSSGCIATLIGNLLGKQTSYTVYKYMLVFEKED